MVKIEINISNKSFYLIIGLILILGLSLGVYAYNKNLRQGNASLMGHSAGEIHVLNSSGNVVTLQQELDELRKKINSNSLIGNIACVTVRALENGEYSIKDTFNIQKGSINVDQVVVYESKKTVSPYPNLNREHFGVRGINNWFVTGCMRFVEGADNDGGIYDNGCYGDVEDAASSRNSLFARFCKVI